MIIVWALSWWYGAGWRVRAALVRERLLSAADYFSIDLLIKSLFSPFRQIDAGKTSGPIAVQWRSFIDRTISRVIGAGIRMVIIAVGSVWLLVYAVFGALTLLLWAIVPFLPLVGFIAMLAGWVPSWI